MQFLQSHNGFRYKQEFKSSFPSTASYTHASLFLLCLSVRKNPPPAPLAALTMSDSTSFLIIFERWLAENPVRLLIRGALTQEPSATITLSAWRAIDRPSETFRTRVHGNLEFALSIVLDMASFKPRHVVYRHAGGLKSYNGTTIPFLLFAQAFFSIFWNILILRRNFRISCPCLGIAKQAAAARRVGPHASGVQAAW